eukprot:m.221948 g.221948  ORF g.221948 m.221948 type:complete len:412 (+) comp39968_c0_seq7:297-1532(+)
MWQPWGRCSVTCGSKGSKSRHRSISRRENCGGTCPSVVEWTNCSSGKCPVDECADDDNNLCDYRCHNTESSYFCSCGSGYELVGKGKCIEKSCNNLPSPLTGRVSISVVSERQIATYSCNHGYLLLGNKERTCREGQWTGTVPSCRDEDECRLKKDDCGENGYCVNYDGSFECRCRDGYDLLNNGKNCTKRCPEGCSRGYCQQTTKPVGSGLPLYKCKCIEQWNGVACNVPICKFGCVNGECVKPDTCVCSNGWTGASCNHPVCSRGCIHGDCVAPERCSCEDGWTGDNCDRPFCGRKCRNEGVCTAPNTCSCKTMMWRGELCTEPFCQNGCENGGNCSAPGTCECPNGFKGTRCEILSCGHDIPPPENSLVNCITFNNQRACTVFCKEGYGFSDFSRNLVAPTSRSTNYS